MESGKTLEVVLHYGTNLRNRKHFSSMEPYATVWVGGAAIDSKWITPVSKHGACNPKWECRMRFNIISMNTDYILFFKIKHRGHVRDRNIGEVQVRFEDLLTADAPTRKVRYQVTTPSGEKQGEITVSHKFSELVMDSDQDDVIIVKELAVNPPRKKKQRGKKIAKEVAEKLAGGGIEFAAEYALQTAINDDE